MNAPRYTIILVASLGLIALAGCSRESESTSSASQAPNQPPPAATEHASDAAGDALDRASRSAKQALDETQEGLSETWNDIKDATYDERASFQASAQELSARVRKTFDDLQAKHPDAPSAAVSELRQASEKLDTEVSKLGAATSDSWTRARTEVAQAWDRVLQELAEFRREISL